LFFSGAESGIDCLRACRVRSDVPAPHVATPLKNKKYLGAIFYKQATPNGVWSQRRS